MTEAPPHSPLVFSDLHQVFDPAVHTTSGTGCLGSNHGREGNADPRDMWLADYLDTSALPPLPNAVHHEHTDFNWQMLGNDQEGDCVPAAQMHAKMKWCLEAGLPQPPVNTASTLALYSAESGYVSGNPNTDQGTDPSYACSYWTNTGVLNVKAGAYLKINRYDYKEVKYAMMLFGGLFNAWDLPMAYQGANVWGTNTNGAIGPWARGSWGGHMTWTVGYDGYHIATVTWGGITLATWKAFGTYASQGSCYAILDPEIINGNQTSPEGLAYGDLMSDLKNRVINFK